MQLTVYTATDSAEEGPSLDAAAATTGHYEGTVAAGRWSSTSREVGITVRIAFHARDETHRDVTATDDLGLWTVIVTMTPTEATHLADTLVQLADAASQAEVDNLRGSIH